MTGELNHLCYGDNLDVLRRYVKDETVDLVYLDPPFKSDADYNVLFAERDGNRAAAQIKAFGDTWRWDQAAATTFQETVEAGGSVAKALLAMRTFLDENDVLAYLSMMAPRLVELRRVMKPHATIYLHCDPTASHYLKLLMDAVFGPKLFLNEIAWCYDTGGRSRSSFPRKHDILLRYGRTGTVAWYYDQVALPRDFSTMHETVRTDEDGRQYQANIKGGKEYRYYLDKGVLPNDWWTDIQALNPAAKERLGYPTQKPEALLERVIAASSKEGDVVLDPFCGCGTTIAVAARTNRRWVGIDITHLATSLIKVRLRDHFGPEIEKTYRTIGEPTSLPDAQMLAAEDQYQFQWWALGLVGARPEDQKKGADRGIDGRLFFHDEGPSGETKQIVFSVKAGKNVGVAMIRDLGHVLTRENAQIGVFITMTPPTQPMRTEAATAGFYVSPWNGQKYPRLQILTVEQILEGKGIDYPAISGGNRTFREAPKAQGSRPSTPGLFDPN